MSAKPNKGKFTPDVFDRAWVAAETEGHCDAIGSAEYRRIRGEWETFVGLYAASLLIVNSANLAPRPTNRKDGGK